MSLNDPDNPGWNALNSHHLHMSIWGDFAARYQPDIFMAAAMPENTISGFDDLKNIVAVDESIFIVGTIPKNLVGRFYKVIMFHK
jgi:hypothetical protein